MARMRYEPHIRLRGNEWRQHRCSDRDEPGYEEPEASVHPGSRRHALQRAGADESQDRPENRQRYRTAMQHRVHFRGSESQIESDSQEEGPLNSVAPIAVGCANDSWGSPVSMAHLGQWWPSAEEPYPPCGRGWTASEASSPGEGFFLRLETPHPVCSLANKPPSPARGEGIQRQSFCDRFSNPSVAPIGVRRL